MKNTINIDATVIKDDANTLGQSEMSRQRNMFLLQLMWQKRREKFTVF